MSSTDPTSRIPQSSVPEVRKPSAAWYLLPIFFGILGGVIMFVVVKDDDRRMAKKGVILGVILTAIWVAVPLIASGLLIATFGHPVYSMPVY